MVLTGMLTALELKDFSAFGHARLRLAPGVNVLIGENACGKTHAMKALYAGLRAHSDEGSGLGINARLTRKLNRVFLPADSKVGHLARRRHGQTTGRVRIDAENGEYFRFSVSSRANKISHANRMTAAPTAIFLPSRELLAIYEGFIAAYDARELAFDETYYDACVALSANPLRGVKLGIQEVIDDLHKVLGGRVQLSGGRFYVKMGAARLEAHLVAEGMRKLAAVVRLLQNGALREHAVLLWDEPEANLNPRLIVYVADVLLSLARLGVQIIIATHDYLLSETLAFRAEQTGVDIMFHSLYRRQTGGPVTAVHADDPGSLEVNPIRDEFLAHYDRIRGL